MAVALALAGVALWAFAEAIAFFIVADVPIMAVALKWGWRRGVLAAIVAALWAGAGGVVVYIAVQADPEWSHAILLDVPGISRDMVDGVLETFGLGSFAAMLAGSFSGIPYKIYAFAAGLRDVPLIYFALASVLARLPRFLLVALVAGWAGPRLRAALPGKRLWVAFVIAWALFYAFYFSRVGL